MERLIRNLLLFLVAAALAVLLVLALLHPAHGASLQRYDGEFRKHWKLRFGLAVDWRYQKAQAMAESGLRPEVCSHVGACGLLQFMPGTWPAYGGQASRFSARASIAAGAAYMRRLWNIYDAGRRPAGDRLALALMAYNAGAGNVIAFRRAAREAGSPAFTWGQICSSAWEEPRTYVERIERWRARFGGRALAYASPPPCSLGAVPPHPLPGESAGARHRPRAGAQDLWRRPLAPYPQSRPGEFVLRRLCRGGLPGPRPCTMFSAALAAA